MASVKPWQVTEVTLDNPAPAARNIDTIRKENITAGFGVAMVIAGLALAFAAIYSWTQWGWEPWANIVHALALAPCVGMICAGALNAWRYSQDEWKDSSERRNLIREVKYLAAKCDAQNSENAELRAEMLEMKADRKIWIASRAQSSAVSYWDEVDAALADWLNELFVDGKPNIYPNKQVVGKMPFLKDTPQYKRAEANGLLDMTGNNYIYTGPKDLDDALALVGGTREQ